MKRSALSIVITVFFLVFGAFGMIAPASAIVSPPSPGGTASIEAVIANLPEGGFATLQLSLRDGSQSWSGFTSYEAGGVFTFENLPAGEFHLSIICTDEWGVTDPRFKPWYYIENDPGGVGSEWNQDSFSISDGEGRVINASLREYTLEATSIPTFGVSTSRKKATIICGQKFDVKNGVRITPFSLIAKFNSGDGEENIAILSQKYFRTAGGEVYVEFKYTASVCIFPPGSKTEFYIQAGGIFSPLLPDMILIGKLQGGEIAP